MTSETTGQSSGGPTPNKRILYIADPMCSWCWGFSPVIAGLAEAAAGRAAVKVVAGGLRPGTSHAMDARAKQAVREHWEHVHTETGQPFDFAFFARNDFVYDTEPACRAVVAVRGLTPAATLAYFHDVQAAFYAGNRDVTDGDTLAELAAAHVDADAFRRRFARPQLVEETWSDFQLSRSLGISGFPSVVLGDDDGYTLLTMGYQPLAHLREPLEVWLTR